MGTPIRFSQKVLLGLISLVGWFGLVMQFYLIIINRTASVPETIIRFFSYFTIWNNLLVAVCSTVLLLRIRISWFNFFNNSQTLTAITVYITVVGIVYNVVLRQLWAPQGLQRVVDEILHLVVPVLFLLFWILFVPKPSFKEANVFKWLLLPLIYLLFALSRGTLSGFYPYPFIDVSKLGMGQVLLNSLGLTVGIIALSFFLLLIGRLVGSIVRHRH